MDGEIQERTYFLPPGRFVRHLIEKRDIPRHRTGDKDNDFEVQYLDLSVLKLNASPMTPFLFWKGISGHRKVPHEKLTKVLPELIARSRNTSAQFVVFVVGGKIEPAPRYDLIQRFGRESIVIIDQIVIENVV